MKNKRVLIVLSLLILFITGCSKKIECIYDADNELKYTSTITISYKDDEIKTATNIIKYETEEIQKTMCDIFKLSEEEEVKVICNQKEVKIENYNKSLEKDFDTKTKNKLIEYLEKNNYVCKTK